jgi:hypothetical protein
MWIINEIFNNFSISFSIKDIVSILTKFSGKTVFVFSIASIILMEVIQYHQDKQKTFYIFDSFSKYIRYGWYYSLLFLIIFFGYFGAQSFIYFQF